MSWGVRASILIALHSREGQLCSAEWIAARLVMSVQTVAAQCSEMAIDGSLDAALIAGFGMVFGVDVTAEHPTVNHLADGPSPETPTLPETPT